MNMHKLMISLEDSMPARNVEMAELRSQLAGISWIDNAARPCARRCSGNSRIKVFHLVMDTGAIPCARNATAGGLAGASCHDRGAPQLPNLEPVPALQHYGGRNAIALETFSTADPHAKA
jgi:hypothetical protein